MSGANSIHKQLRSELENYIRSQYFGKSPLLLDAISDHLDDEGLVYRKPYIESSPAYKSIPDGISNADLPNWLKAYFRELSEANLGIFPSPFVHQIRALEAFTQGKDLFVSTGTGSGKTECFMWPLLAKLADEAKNSSSSWAMRGVRTVVMYPMNALVSDQVSRLRKLIGDPDGKFIDIFRKTSRQQSRRPQFGMYTGRTPYPGPEPDERQDKQLKSTLARMSFPKQETEKEFFNKLTKEGKVPAKTDMNGFLTRLGHSCHIPDDEDAELITRFEMQQFCPDILITNYSMLEYMLLRPIENRIWADTRAWLQADSRNKLLFVIDEAHMYRGSSGGEVAFLIRRLLHKLQIGRERVQFILTTASMPNANEEDRTAVEKFAMDLTAGEKSTEFRFLSGEREETDGKLKYDIPFSKFNSQQADILEASGQEGLNALNQFWEGLEGFPGAFGELSQLCAWMYNHLIEYRPFFELINACRGTAVSLEELAQQIFPDKQKEDALNGVGILLAIAPQARSEKGAVLFPARMHMLFKGIKGVYACTNPQCPHSHSDGELTLGEIFLNDKNLVCPHCGSTVYELYNDRRCGALFLKGYLLENELNPGALQGSMYLWHYPGQLLDQRMKEIHLYIPPDDYNLPAKQGKNPVRPCYLDTQSGYVHFTDDAMSGKPGIRKLYYCNYCAKGRPSVITFPTCPHCRHLLSFSNMSSFSTKGNQSFFNLIKSQFQAEPPVPGKDRDPDHLPNEGRKVLLFSDSRQRAAKLARDMSEASDITAARQLFALAVSTMEKSTEEQSMNSLYDYFCLAAAQHHVQIFHGAEREKFVSDSQTALQNYERATRRRRSYVPRYSISNAPSQMQKFLLKLYSGGYNTLYDSATSWIEPTDQALFDSVDFLEESGISITEDEFVELFNAWMLSICDTGTALGHTIPDDIRESVRQNYRGYGLEPNWEFSRTIRDIMGWTLTSQESSVYKRVLQESFLDSAQPDNGRLYVDLSRVKPRFNPDHPWFKCEQCSEITPFLLRGRCPICGCATTHKMEKSEYDALSFWREPVQSALDGERIRVIDTEEHTAQISHKDQRNNLWSRTEQYELRFQDLIQEDETPVDILSSTTTMEVGIDIGSLVAVGLRNIPPMRENYQQRAGRAGRRGSSLSTIVTFCEDGPHDTLYFKDPVPMFRGDPRRPWIDIESPKLLQRHISMVALQAYTATIPCEESWHRYWSLDTISAKEFLDFHLDSFHRYMSSFQIPAGSALIPEGAHFDLNALTKDLSLALRQLKCKRDLHPELYGPDPVSEENKRYQKSLLDALYEEGIIPSYSFPKQVVSTYITDQKGTVVYEVDRGLDVAIGEYAPGRAIVVDKTTYQIGGFYYPGSEFKKGHALSPASVYIGDPNYLKGILCCNKCGWFGLAEEQRTTCPFCGEQIDNDTRPMLRPWGFAPKNARPIADVQLDEEYTRVQQPLYSTLPDAEEMQIVNGCTNIRLASRTNQRIIMMNRGAGDKGFMVCRDCGAAMPGDTADVLKDISRPYNTRFPASKCRHADVINVNLGYDFVTDMMVLEFKLDETLIDTDRVKGLWLDRAAQSLAEGLRLAVSHELDIEFTELVTGYRFRQGPSGAFVDIYLYDNLSSGAGYAISVCKQIPQLLQKTKQLLEGCTCRSACQNCLKHYRNIHIHGMLDRFAALDLLAWGQHQKMAPALNLDQQWDYVHPLQQILKTSEVSLLRSNDSIYVLKDHKELKLVVYPAMWREPKEKGTICVSDAYLKYARPYAVQKILDRFGH